MWTRRGLAEWALSPKSLREEKAVASLCEASSFQDSECVGVYGGGSVEVLTSLNKDFQMLSKHLPSLDFHPRFPFTEHGKFHRHPVAVSSLRQEGMPGVSRMFGHLP